MLDYKKLIKLAKEASEREKKLSFELGAPWIYCDKTREHIIYEYKNGAKEIKDRNGHSVEIIPPPKGI